MIYRLLRPVHRTLALMAAAFRLVQAAVIAVSLLARHAALLILSGDLQEREALALFALELQGHGYDLALIFFGMNSLLTGWLVLQSRFLPRLLGMAVMAAGMVYLVGSYILFLAPGLSGAFRPGVPGADRGRDRLP